MSFFRFFISVIFLVFIAFPALAGADVVVERYTKSGGIYGIGGFEGTSKDSIKGDKKHTRDNTKFTGKVMGFLAGNDARVTIIRVADDVVYELDEKNKLYTTSPITIPREEKGEGKPEEDKKGDKPGEDKKSTTRIVKNEIKVKKTGEKKAINGFGCEQYIMTWHIVTEDTQTGAQSDYLMTNDSWLTPETKQIKALMNEELEFTKAYIKKMGFGNIADNTKNFGLELMAGVLKTPKKQLEKEMAKMKGYPVASAVQWEVKSDEGAKGESGASEQDGEEEPSGGGLGGLVGALGKELAKSVMKSDKKGSDGRSVVFDSYSELKSITQQNLDPALFAPPEGYKEGQKKKFGLF